jgi:hypothetical protein
MRLLEALTCLLLLTSVTCAHDVEARAEVYEDLMKDLYAAKLITEWYRCTGETESFDLDKLIQGSRWLQEQDGKAFPVLLEVAQRETEIRQFCLVLDYLRTNPGDRSDALKLARHSLPWIVRCTREAGKNDEYRAALFRSTIMLLSSCGSAEDVGLLAKFSEETPQSDAWSSTVAEELRSHMKALTIRLKNEEAEQAGTGQPATRPESKSEGGDKPQPEAEGRSR